MSRKTPPPVQEQFPNPRQRPFRHPGSLPCLRATPFQRQRSLPATASYLPRR